MLNASVTVVAAGNSHVFHRMAYVNHLMSQVLRLIRRPSVVFMVQVNGHGHVVQFERDHGRLVLVDDDRHLISKAGDRRVGLMMTFRGIAVLQRATFRFLGNFNYRQSVLRFILVGRDRIVRAVFCSGVKDLSVFKYRQGLLGMVLAYFQIVKDDEFRSNLRQVNDRFTRLSFKDVLDFIYRVLVGDKRFFLASAPIVFRHAPSPFALRDYFSL